MSLARRAARYARIWRANVRGGPSPPFLVLFVTSSCNMRCGHCFYWQRLNQGDDLSFEELEALSRSLGLLETLNLSGGEPFLRADLARVCRQFVRQNSVREIYIPTNGYFTERTLEQVARILEEPGLGHLAVELSLDGSAEHHDRLRGCPGAFERAMETYQALDRLRRGDPRLLLHAVSTATRENLAEIRALTSYLFENCPGVEHHNLALVRGDRRDPSLSAPDPSAYAELYEFIRCLWARREAGRPGGSVEPMLQWAKLRILAEGRQVVPCRAGVLSAVVYANGDVGVCELHEPLGNLREHPFPEIWSSAEAQTLRAAIARGECHCTNEVFLWPSIVFQPLCLEAPAPQGRTLTSLTSRCATFGVHLLSLVPVASAEAVCHP
jgi:MoaA/NifB/PqqE/SkfB family radical SAM enzyme